MDCPCQSKRSFDQCCTPYINGDQLPPTPEALMRSRYSAYTKANVDYIANTMKGKALRGFIKTDAKKWASEANWLGLNILSSNNDRDDHGYVEFAARFKSQNRLQIIHEISEFKKEDGKWFYIDGQTQKPPGRNSPCLCGSGKKFKRCCSG